MEKVKTIIRDYIKTMDGYIIGIGLDNQLINDIEKNKSILSCDLLDDNSSKGSGKASQKRLYYKDIRKRYKKKRINYIVGDIEKVDKCKKTFIMDSIYINKNKIIYYGIDDTKIDLFLKRYQRYDADIKVIDCLDGKVIVIDTKDSHNSYLKDKLYYIYDNIYELIDYISDIFAT